MRLSFQLALIVLIGLGVVYAGVSNMYAPSSVLVDFYEVDISEFPTGAKFAIETQIRLLSGMWVAVGLTVIFSATKFETNANLLRAAFLGLSLGALAELYSAYHMDQEVRPVLIKVALQITICVGMEVWRVYMVRRGSVSK